MSADCQSCIRYNTFEDDSPSELTSRCFEKITILDWDDTILPTTWLFRNYCQTGQLTEEQINILEQTQQSVYEFLQCVVSNSTRVIIITNAEKEWVIRSCETFFKSVYPLINEEIRIVSARDEYSNQTSIDSSLWKQYTFQRVLDGYRGCMNKKMISVFSIGDSLYERQAVMNYGKHNDDICVKSIKMMEGPSPSQLIKQQELITKHLPSMINKFEPLDLKLALQP